MPVALVSSPSEFREECERARAAGRAVAFVPTMGALHEGHLALVREGRRRVGDTGLVATSIFVNPTQFGPNEDLNRYPRDLEGDREKLARASCDLVFCPTPLDMYPVGERTRVRVDGLTAGLCGPFRPGHFEGVATVVTKLLALAGKCVAIFGKKDYQQLAVIRRLALDLLLGAEVVGLDIVREPSGLAMSSRNAYLTPAEHDRARTLSSGLLAAWQAFEAGERDKKRLIDAVVNELKADSIDYVDLVDHESLEPAPSLLPKHATALLAIACRVGKTRLIDNLVLGQDGPPRTP